MGNERETVEHVVLLQGKYSAKTANDDKAKESGKSWKYIGLWRTLRGGRLVWWKDFKERNSNIQKEAAMILWMQTAVKHRRRTPWS